MAKEEPKKQPSHTLVASDAQALIDSVNSWRPFVPQVMQNPLDQQLAKILRSFQNAE